MKKKFDINSFLEFQFVSDPRYSPDGKYISFIVQRADRETNGYQGDIYVIDQGSPRRLTGRGDAKNACWTPRNTLLFSARRNESQKNAEKEGRLLTAYYEIGLNGGEAGLAFTLPMKAKGLTWMEGELFYFTAEYERDGMLSPEERLALSKREQVYYSFDELPFMKKNQGFENGKRNRLYVYNRATGEITAVSGENEEVTHVSHQGHRLIYSAAGYTVIPGVRDEDVSICTYDALTGGRDTVMEPHQLMLRACEVYGEFWGDKIVVFGSKGEFYGRTESPAVWLIDPKTHEITLFFTYLYNIDYRSMMSDSKLGGGQRLKVEGDRIYFLTSIGYSTYIRCLDQAGNLSETLTPDGSIDGFDVHNGNLAYAGFYGDKLEEIYENGRQLTHFNDHIGEEYAVVTPVYHSFTDKDGYEIDGWYMPPADYRPGEKYPAILHIHGGPRSTISNVFFHEHQLWASKGYFVFFCNPRGSDGKGDEFASVWGRYGSFDYDDLMQFTDEILKLCPDIDQRRVGVTGGSYAGFMTNWIIGHTDRFKAAISQRGIANLTTFEFTTNIGYFFTPNNHHAKTSTNAEKLWDFSPLKYAHNCKTPTLFIHSDKDYVCGLPEGYQMYTALKMSGVESRLCVFHGEGHELSRSGRPLGRIGRLSEMLSWWDSHLR